MRSVRHLLVVVIMTVACGSAMAEIIEEIVAKVNGEMISRSELMERQQQIEVEVRSQVPEEQMSMAMREVKKNVLVDLINEKLLYQRAERIGLDLDQVYKSTLDNIKRQNGIESNDELRELLDSQGMTLREFRDSLLRYNVPQIMIDLEVRQTISVTPEEVKEFYDDNLDEFHHPASFSFREIALLLTQHTKEAALEIVQTVTDEVAGGEDFAMLVEQYSESPSRDQGGLVENLPTSEMSEMVMEVLDPLEPGQVSEPLVTERAVLIFQLVSKRDAAVDQLEDVTERIELVVRNGKMEAELEVYLTKLWDDNQVDILPKYRDEYPTDRYRSGS